MTPAAPRKVVRVSTLTFVSAMSVMMRGPFKASDIVDETGLHRDTVYRLISAMLRMNVCHESGLAPDAIGRNAVRVFTLGAKRPPVAQQDL